MAPSHIWWKILDTAGQEEFLLFRDSSISHGDVFLMLFAIDQLSSWHTLQELRKKFGIYTQQHFLT